MEGIEMEGIEMEEELLDSFRELPEDVKKKELLLLKLMANYYRKLKNKLPVNSLFCR